ncbi:MAG: FAA hydrolase family protein [Phycisphaerales bacterium]|nr:FAA hydrolase family protein [Phycisphaerales bacterium]
MTRPPAIICIGRNYADHASEMGGTVPTRPVVFFKNPASIVPSGATIVIPTICREGGPQVDYEGELAVILGRDCLDIPESDALACVAGYAIANDVSARWWQNQGAGGQFSRGKSFDTFCPMTDPVDASRVPDPQALRIVTRVNGEIRQDASTAKMIFSVSRLVSELSRATTLHSGTIILTGSPAGVGHARNPPVYLRDGDRVEVSIDPLGLLVNTVVEAP